MVRSRATASSAASRRYITSYAGPPSTKSAPGLTTGCGIRWPGSTGGGRLPVSAVSAASRITTTPRPPASTTPASLRAWSWSGVRARASRAARALVVSTSRERTLGSASTSSWAASDGGLADRQHRALDRPAHGGVRRLGGAPERVDHHRAVALLGRRVGDPADDRAQHLAEDHPGVAAGAEQRAAREDLEDRRPVGRALLAHGVAGRGHGQVHVGAGVAVGDRVDVERVDLLARPGQRVHGQVDEAEHGRETDPVTHCTRIAHGGEDRTAAGRRGLGGSVRVGYSPSVARNDGRPRRFRHSPGVL